MYAQYTYDNELILHSDFDELINLIPVTLNNQYLNMFLSNMSKHVAKEYQSMVFDMAKAWLSKENVFLSDTLLYPKSLLRGYDMNLSSIASPYFGYSKNLDKYELFLTRINIVIGGNKTRHAAHMVGTFTNIPTGLVYRRSRQGIIEDLLLEL